MAENLLITRMTSDDIDDVVLLDRSIFMIRGLERHSPVL